MPHICLSLPFRNFTLLLDESTDNVNRSELSLIASNSRRGRVHPKPLFDPRTAATMQELVKAETVATLCFLSDVSECTNSLQLFLQTARLNPLDLPFQVKKVTDKLELIKSDPFGNDNSNFARLDSFLEITFFKRTSSYHPLQQNFQRMISLKMWQNHLHLILFKKLIMLLRFQNTSKGLRRLTLKN